MSYLLEALKKSETQSDTPLPDILTDTHTNLIEDDTSSIDWFKVGAIAAIVILAMVVAYLLGKEAGREIVQVPAVPITTPAESSTEASLPTAQSNVSNPAKLIPQARPAKTQSIESATTNTDVNWPAQTTRNNNTQLSQAEMGFVNPAAFNQPQPKAVKPSQAAEQPKVVATSTVGKMQQDNDEEEGRLLTGKNRNPFLEDKVEVSDQLMRRFMEAVEDTANLSDTQISASSREAAVPKLVNLPQAFQDAIPSLDFQTHIYSSDPLDRWLKVNGGIKTEGQMITPQIRLNQILPQQVILEYDDQEFSLPALSNW